MTKTTCTIAAAVATLLAAGSARAQICAGFPIADNQGSVGALADFPSGFNDFGVEGAFNFRGPFSANAGYIRSEETGAGDTHLDTFRVGAAFDISGYTAGFLPGVSICPNVRADFASQDDVDSYLIPVGLGLGVSVPVGSPGMSLSPYVIPAIYFIHLSDGTDSFSDNKFGIRGGADVNVDRFYFGGTIEWINAEGSDAVFGVRAGIKF